MCISVCVHTIYLLVTNYWLIVWLLPRALKYQNDRVNPLFVISSGNLVGVIRIIKENFFPVEEPKRFKYHKHMLSNLKVGTSIRCSCFSQRRLFSWTSLLTAEVEDDNVNSC